MAEHIRTVAYINGVRFFPRAVAFSAQAGSTASFSLDVPAVPHWDMLQPRAHAAVFFEDPVVRQWRLLCEGDYIGYARGKTGDGTMSRSLQFRALHGSWDSIPYAALSSVFGETATAGREDAIQRLMTARANGFDVIPSAQPQFNVFSLQEFVERTTTPGTRISAFIRQFFKACVSQIPAEVFYYNVRRVFDKSYALRDEEINTMIDFARIKDVSQNGIQAMGINFNSPLRQVVEAYEDLAMYQHLTLPAPPIYSQRGGESDTPFTIPELLFVPHLYNTVPPACNVIFADQCTMDQVNRNFSQEPTRIIGQLVGVEGTQIPLYYMANNPEGGLRAVRTLLNVDMDPRGAVSHELLSREELVRGVRPQVVPVGIHKLGIQGYGETADTPSLQHYMDLATRHHYEVERGRMHVVVLNCAFLPYLVPGFPCLIENKQGALHGVISAVSHSITQGGASTSVTINHIREAYVEEGVDRTPPMPSWLNRSFRPENIAATLAKLLGPNLAGKLLGTENFGAMLPKIITKASFGGSAFAQELADLDEHAAQVVPVLRYDQSGAASPAYPVGTTIADRLRTNPVAAQQNMLRYQFRPGTTISQYMAFHALGDDSQVSDWASDDPPRDLSPRPNRLFGIPHGLKFIGQQGTLDRQNEERIFGVYELQARGGSYFSDVRQQTARAIQRAIDQQLTRG